MSASAGDGVRPLTRDDLRERDRTDPLASFRDRFELPEGVIYLDGNSLGPPSRNMRARVEALLRDEWGRDLIASWNRHGWFRLPERVGARIAPLLGVGEDEVIAADSVSLNLFKLLAALLTRAGPRRVVLAEETNFPTDLYMAEGLVSLLRDSGAKLRLVSPDDFQAALGPEVAVATLTQVNFRTGRKHDLRRLTATARAAGVPIVWDLSHSAGAFPLHLNERRRRVRGRLRLQVSERWSRSPRLSVRGPGIPAVPRHAAFRMDGTPESLRLRDALPAGARDAALSRRDPGDLVDDRAGGGAPEL